MSEMFKYYAVNLVPREVTEDGYKIGYGAPTVVTLEIPGDNRGIINCSKYTNYGYALFREEENFELNFEQLRINQIKNTLEVVNEALEAGANGSPSAYEEAKRLCAAISELTALPCPTVDADGAVRRAPATCAPGVETIEQRVTAVQTWEATTEGGMRPSGWTLEDGSPLPENVVMVEQVESIQISEELELPTKAIFKVRAA